MIQTEVSYSSFGRNWVLAGAEVLCASDLVVAFVASRPDDLALLEILQYILKCFFSTLTSYIVSYCLQLRILNLCLKKLSSNFFIFSCVSYLLL